MEYDSTKFLIYLIKESNPGNHIVVDDLIKTCNNSDELYECIIESFEKNIRIMSIKQPWLDSNNNNDNALILALKMRNLLNESNV